MNGNVEEILDKVSSVVKFARDNCYFIEFYIYSSSYMGFIQQCHPMRENSCGVGLYVIKDDIEFYYYEDSLNIVPLLDLLEFDLGFKIDYSKRDKSKIKVFGEAINVFDSSEYIDKARKYLADKQHAQITMSISAHYEEVIIYNNKNYALDRRAFQKLLVYNNQKIIDTYSQHGDKWIGHEYDKCPDKFKVVSLKSFSDFPSDFDYVIFLPKAAGILIHEVCGHMLEYDYFDEKNPFWGKIGKQIAPPFFTIRDNPFLMYGDKNHVDDEGNVICSHLLIDKGILRGIIGSEYANHQYYDTDIDVFASARRETHEFLATGRNYCLEVGCGEISLMLAIEKYPNALIIEEFRSACYDSEAGIVKCSSDRTYKYNGQEFIQYKQNIHYEIKGNTFLNNLVEVCCEPEYYENMCYSSSGFVSNATSTPSIVAKNSSFTYSNSPTC